MPLKSLLQSLIAHQIQLIARDSKGTSAEAALQAANIVGLECYTELCQDAKHPANAPIMGFIGPGSPDAVAKVQRLLQLPHVDIAQTIYSSRSPVLSNTGFWKICSPAHAVACISTRFPVHFWMFVQLCSRNDRKVPAFESLSANGQCTTRSNVRRVETIAKRFARQFAGRVGPGLCLTRAHVSGCGKRCHGLE